MIPTGSLTVSDYYDINDKISDTSSFYDISHKMLSPLSRVVGAESSIFAVLRKNSRGMVASNFVSNSVDKESTTNYEKYFQNADPVLPHAFNSTQLCHRLKQSKSFTFILDNIVDPRKFSCGEYYNEFLRPNSLRQILAMGVPSSVDSSLIYILGFHRYSEHPFEQKDTLASSYFGPTLFNILNGLELKRQLHDRNVIVSQLQNQVSETGLIVINARHEIIFANQTGQKHINIRPTGNDRYTSLDRELIAELDARLPLKKQPVTREAKFQFGMTEISCRVITADSHHQEQRIILHTQRSAHKVMNSLEMEKYDLTRRETDIAALIVQGLTNLEISDRLFISTRTVENHLRSIYNKANVKNRTSLAYKLGPDGE